MPGLAGAQGLVLDVRLDPDHGGEFGEAVFAGKAAASGHPVDAMANGGAALLDAAVALFGVAVGIEDLGGRIVEEALDLVMKRWLVVLHRQ